jgi:hypothetical protein
VTLPNFLGIGVQRAATTWLHDAMSQHPDVFLPGQKELHFFNEGFDRGLAWYQDQFGGWNGQRAIGEITPLYFHRAPFERIAGILPGVKVIVILRDPVDRAFSAYQLLNEHFGGMTFREACNTDRGRFLIECSHYAEKLQDAFKTFGQDHTLVLLYEDVVTRPHEVVQQVCRFLGVSQDFRAEDLDTVKNRIVYPNAQRMLRNLHLGWVVTAVRDTRLGAWIKKRQKTSMNATRRRDTDFEQELREMFSEDVSRVESLIGRDLARWRQHTAAVAV